MEAPSTLGGLLLEHRPVHEETTVLVFLPHISDELIPPGVQLASGTGQQEQTP